MIQIMKFSHCLLFLSFNLSPQNILASTIPQTSNLPLNDTATVLGAGEVHCTKKKNPLSLNPGAPVYKDCLKAIEQLPTDPSLGAFHNGGPQDPFKLPVIKTSGRCAVIVALNTGTSKSSTTTSGNWYHVTFAASQINIICVSWSRFSLYTGGWTGLGRTSRPIPDPPGPDPDPDPHPDPSLGGSDTYGQIIVQVLHAGNIGDLDAFIDGGLGNGTWGTPIWSNGTTNFDAIV